MYLSLELEREREAERESHRERERERERERMQICGEQRVWLWVYIGNIEPFSPALFFPATV